MIVAFVAVRGGRSWSARMLVLVAVVMVMIVNMVVTMIVVVTMVVIVNMVMPMVVIMAVVVLMVVARSGASSGRAPDRYGLEGHDQEQGDASNQHGKMELLMQVDTEHVVVIEQDHHHAHGAANAKRADLLQVVVARGMVVMVVSHKFSLQQTSDASSIISDAGGLFYFAHPSWSGSVCSTQCRTRA